ncbi:acidPPc domain-containing protein [Mycena chlorophos]|uniref:AcidPPc domain-containing protein n=1 Tax=Mycena chlorophos TaxID=658473 RepID=A0A8H6VX02_MYCCL|nr:acidPPc domain-containing protein [Mycena chlorophos]
MPRISFRGGPTVSQALATVYQALLAAIARLDKSLNPNDTLDRLRRHKFTWSDSIYLFHLASLAFWLPLMRVPGYPEKLLIPILFAIAFAIPLTCQFFLPALPVFAYLLMFYTSQFIPTPWRPNISVSLLPTLESVLFGANVSDILTRFTHPVLDIIAWLPYGFGHFVLPFVLAAFVWLFRTKEVLHLWAKMIGYFNYIGVLTQILLPCAAPWYEIIHGLTPANYGMKGSPGGLLRIDRLFGGNGYTVTFSNAPVVFGAFPSLHAGSATLEALFISHFFPQATRYVWAYAGVLYWATMYLSHHYLIDVVGGGCLAVFFFYVVLPDEFRNPALATALPPNLRGSPRSKYEAYDLEAPRARDFDLTDGEAASDEEDVDIAYRSPLPDGMNGSKQSGPGRGKKGAARSHKHTASIASLIREGERAPEEAWNNSPIGSSFFEVAGDVESGRR